MSLTIGLAMVLLPVVAANGATTTCAGASPKLGWCPTADGTNLDVTGTLTTPGSPGTSGGNHSWGESGPGGASDRPADDDRSALEDCVEAAQTGFGCYGDATDEEPARPAVTMTDLVRFTPPAASLEVEPEGIAVVGLPANIVAPAGLSEASGTLLGFPLTARFTPVAFVFDYGDGTTRTHSTGGRTLASLGQSQFTPTPTSHVYRERGTVTIRVDIRYSAEVRFDGHTGWFPVAGELTAHGTPTDIRVYEARTALVDQTCTQNPTAAGC